MKPTKTEKIMTAEELFEKLEHTGNHYSSFYMGRKYVYFSTGGWSENEDLIRELRKTFIFKMLLVEWKYGGHYKFKKTNKNLKD